MTGLGYDPATGTIWTSDVIGAVFHFTPPPALTAIGLQPVAFAVAGDINAGGLAVNSSNIGGAFPPPPCSTQSSGFQICVTDGVFVYDAIPGVALPIPIPNPNPPPGLGAVYGLAFSNDFQITPGSVGCMTTGTNPVPGTLMPNFVGPGPANALTLASAPPATASFLGIDLCLAASPFVAPATGEALWLDPTSPSLLIFATMTNAAGEAFFPVSYPAGFEGIQFSFQWAIPDPAHQLNVCLTDACTVTLGLR
jgi:hypothetical protein